MNEYLIKTWIGNGQVEVKVVYEKDLWALLDDAKKNSTSMSVYKLGECVLDWS